VAKRKPKAYAFLDTNIFLEFKDFDQIDWPAVLGYRHICLVVSPVTLTEIERFKYDQKSERRQARSRLITKKLHDIIFSVSANEEASIPGRSGVTLLALTASPNVSSYPGLEHTIADDQLIASVLTFTADRSDTDRQDILLIGDDGGCLNKARARGVVARRLDDQFRLPDEPSATQKELAQLKRQLQDLQFRQPKLSLAVMTESGLMQELGSTCVFLRTPSPAAFDELCDKEQAATLWEAPKAYTNKKVSGDPNSSAFQVANLAQAALIASQMQYSEEEIERYSIQRQAYLMAYQKYLRTRFQWEEQRRRRAQLTLTIINDGVAPALGVVVRVIVPDGLKVYDEDSLPPPPRPPRRPSKPRTEMERMFASINLATRIAPPFIPSSSSIVRDIDPNTIGPDITPYNSTLVRWKRPKVLHHLHLELTPIILEFPRLEGERAYELGYELIADNVPAPVEGTIKITVRGQEQPFDLAQIQVQPTEEEEEYEDDDDEM
jgi:hypothetical protein